MVDVLKAVVDALSRLVPALAGKRRDKRLRRVGLRLFLIYVRLVEALITADRIIDDLEHFARQTHDAGLLDRLAHRLEEQAGTVTRLRRLLEENSEALILLDAECYARLAPLLHIKMGFLLVLEGALSGSELPLDCSEADIASHAELAAALVAERPSRVDNPLALTSFRAMSISHYAFRDRRHTLRLRDPEGERPDKGTARMVKRYLADRHPREEVALLKEAAARLGATLSEHFSVEEVLLQVGEDGRLDPD